MDDLFLRIYENMYGVTIRKTAPFPVDNLFSEGSVCGMLYREIFLSKIKICDRLNEDEDIDLENICDNFWAINEIMCRKMFEYGKAVSSKSQ